MGKYTEMSRQVLELVGGVDNITLVERCTTRLRIHYAKKSMVDVEGIKGVENVLGVVDKAGQVQIIIGPSVNDAMNDFLEVSGWQPGEGGVRVVDDEPEEKNFMYYLNKFGNSCAAVFMPIIPALVTGGLILAIKNLLVNYFGLGVDSGTAKVCLAIFARASLCFPSGLAGRWPTSLRWSPSWVASWEPYSSMPPSAALRALTSWASPFQR